MKFREELLRAVAELEIGSRRNISALLSGKYQSRHRGSGMQFKEFRNYVAGDDIRHMSWTVTARTGRPTLKIYEEERELNVVLLVDVSGSSQFGQAGLKSHAPRKLDMYAELVALLGLAAVRNEDNFGFLLFHTEPLHYLPPRKNKDYVLTALSKIGKETLDGRKSDIRSALKFLAHSLTTPSLVVILSDFQMPSFQAELKLLSQRHEAILLHCYDDAERGMGKQEGIYEVWDPETKEFELFDTQSADARKVLNLDFFQRSAELEKISRNCRSDYLTLSLEDDYLQRMVHFFRNRA